MKSFALLCFLLLACAFVVRAEEEAPAVDEPKTEDQPEVAADEEQPEENDEEEADEEKEDDEEDESTEVAEDEEKRTLYGCKPICHLRCKPKYCSKRVCKTVKCGYRKVCRYITKYRIVKYKYKLPYNPYGYGPKYGYKLKKVPYTVTKCHLVAKYCTRCHYVKYVCGKTCHKVCKQRKCYYPHY